MICLSESLFFGFEFLFFKLNCEYLLVGFIWCGFMCNFEFSCKY